MIQSPFELLLSLKQTGSVEEYLERFELYAGPLKCIEPAYSVASSHTSEGVQLDPLDLEKIYIYPYIIYILNPLIFLYCTTDPTKLKPIFTYSFSNFILSL
jgi:hypothetical protein